MFICSLLDIGRPDVLNATYEGLPLVPCDWAQPMEYGACHDYYPNGSIRIATTYPDGFIDGRTSTFMFVLVTLVVVGVDDIGVILGGAS